MGKRSVIIFTTVCVALMFSAGASYAGKKVDDVLKMNRPEYKEHTKSIVEFTHKKHAEDYKIGCGECHHDDKGKPIEGLKMDDDVKSCIECHKIPGTMPGKLKKEMREQKASKEDVNAKKLEYHAEAVHMNCISCHKAHNKKNNTKAAPATCTKCHPKEK